MKARPLCWADDAVRSEPVFFACSRCGRVYPEEQRPAAEACCQAPVAEPAELEAEYKAEGSEDTWYP